VYPNGNVKAKKSEYRGEDGRGLNINIQDHSKQQEIGADCGLRVIPGTPTGAKGKETAGRKKKKGHWKRNTKETK